MKYIIIYKLTSHYFILLRMASLGNLQVKITEKKFYNIYFLLCLVSFCKLGKLAIATFFFSQSSDNDTDIILNSFRKVLP